MRHLCSLLCCALTLAVQAAEPDWIYRGVYEENGLVLAVGVASDADKTRALRLAMEQSQSMIAEFHSIAISSTTTLTSSSTNETFRESLEQRIETSARVRLRRGVASRDQYFKRTSDGTFLAYVQASIPAKDLFPERRLQEVLKRPVADRMPALLALADQYQVEGFDVLSELALLQAVALPQVNASTFLRLAWHYHRQHDDVSARRYLLSAERLAGPDTLPSCQALRSAIMSALPDAYQLNGELVKLTESSADAQILDVTVQNQGSGQFLVIWNVLDGPLKLLTIWTDGEDVALMDLGNGTHLPFNGSAESTIRLDPSSRGGEILAWALSEDDRAWSVVEQFGSRLISLARDRASEEDRLVLRSLLLSLRRSSRPGIARPAASFKLLLRP